MLKILLKILPVLVHDLANFIIQKIQEKNAKKNQNETN
jgi:hypothetical protein